MNGIAMAVFQKLLYQGKFNIFYMLLLFGIRFRKIRCVSPFSGCMRMVQEDAVLYLMFAFFCAVENVDQLKMLSSLSKSGEGCSTMGTFNGLYKLWLSRQKALKYSYRVGKCAILALQLHREEQKKQESSTQIKYRAVAL